MSKIQMTYKELYDMCQGIAYQAMDEEKPFTQIIAVTRGGLSAAHILGKMLGLPVGIFVPDTKAVLLPKPHNPNGKYLVVEDLVARGRTYEIVKKFFNEECECDWEFCPILIDSEYYREHSYEFKYFGFVTSLWVVFPYEDFDSVVAGDRGLFRDNSDQYKDGRSGNV
jgi:hypoxanthine phosphoribosyltransferase